MTVERDSCTKLYPTRQSATSLLCYRKVVMVGCEKEFKAVNTCVQKTAECTSCFEPSTFKETFPTDAENYFRNTLAHASPSKPDFCLNANWFVCKKYYPPEGPASCCCRRETKRYNKCMFQGWLGKYLVADTSCEYRGCEMFDLERTMNAQEQKEQKDRAFAIGMSVGLAVSLCVCFVGLYVYHRKTKAPAACPECIHTQID